MFIIELKLIDKRYIIYQNLKKGLISIKNNIIIRADFCPDGDVIPISITFIHKDAQASSLMINRTKTIKSKGNYKKILCNTAGKDFYLSFNGFKWTYEDLNDKIRSSNNHYDNHTNYHTKSTKHTNQSHRNRKDNRKCC